MKYVLHKIKELAELDDTKEHEWMLHLIEECGEVSQCISTSLNLKNKNLKETTREELVDVVINALAMYFQYGGSSVHLNEYMLKKLKRWETRLQEKNNQ